VRGGENEWSLRSNEDQKQVESLAGQSFWIGEKKKEKRVKEQKGKKSKRVGRTGGGGDR